MPLGQFYPGVRLREEPEVHDAIIGYNVGMATATPALIQPNLPGSGVTTAAIPQNAFVYLRGGTVLSVILTIGGATLVTSTNSMFFVPGGKTFAVNYVAGAPSWFWQAM